MSDNYNNNDDDYSPVTQVGVLRIVRLVHPTTRACYALLVSTTEYSRRETYIFGAHEGWQIDAGPNPDHTLGSHLATAVNLRFAVSVETVAATAKQMVSRFVESMQPEWSELAVARGWMKAPESAVALAQGDVAIDANDL